MRKTKRIEIYSSSSCYDIPERASEFMAFWQRHLDSIPAEFRDTARIEIEAITEYNDPSLSVEISYTRPESDSEMEKREGIEKVLSDKRREDKLLQYNRLKKELGL